MVKKDKKNPLDTLIRLPLTSNIIRIHTANEKVETVYLYACHVVMWFSTTLARYFQVKSYLTKNYLYFLRYDRFMEILGKRYLFWFSSCISFLTWQKSYFFTNKSRNIFWTVLWLLQCKLHKILLLLLKDANEICKSDLYTLFLNKSSA